VCGREKGRDWERVGDEQKKRRIVYLSFVV
jgi:hypothetical protein